MMLPLPIADALVASAAVANSAVVNSGLANAAFAPVQEAASGLKSDPVYELPIGGNLYFPDAQSTVAADIDGLFYFILWISIISFVILIGGALLFMWKYRAREGHKRTITPTHDARLEATWTVIPTIIVAIIFYVGFEGFMDLREAPGDSYEIQVTAQQWAWSFKYPNGAESSDLYVPMGEPVKLVMTSMDVLHSLFIPEFRVKQDVVPGRYTSLWFESLPSEGGEGYLAHLFCTEYCGTEHSNMNRLVHVLPRDEFDQWAADTANFYDQMPLHLAGEIVYQRACASCHLVEPDQIKIGPSFGNLSVAVRDGAEIQFSNTGPVVADENYLRESILMPAAKVRRWVGGDAGSDGPAYEFPNQMNSFAGQLSEEHLTALIAYIKSLADESLIQEYEAEFEQRAADESEEG